MDSAEAVEAAIQALDQQVVGPAPGFASKALQAQYCSALGGRWAY